MSNIKCWKTYDYIYIVIVNIYLITKIMKKILLTIGFLVILWGCGTKQLDDMNMTWSTKNWINSGNLNTGNAYDGAIVQQFASGSDKVIDGNTIKSWQANDQIITDMKPSRISDEWCIWKKYSKFGITFLWEKCELDGRSLEIVAIDSKQAFAIKQDNYDIDPENLDDTLWLQVFDTKWSTIADTIKKIAGSSCDITKITNKTIDSFDLYTVKDNSNTSDGNCSGYADTNADDSKLFLIDTNKPTKIVFMNITNQQNLIDLKNLKIN